jgi:hypothetical protein
LIYLTNGLAQYAVFHETGGFRASGFTLLAIRVVGVFVCSLRNV